MMNVKEAGMGRKKSQYPPGRHPNTLASLKEKHYEGGRPREFDTPKKARGVTLTDEAWDNIKVLAKERGYRSTSEFLEMLGRGEVKLSA